jgi:hypothetical protein
MAVTVLFAAALKQDSVPPKRLSQFRLVAVVLKQDIVIIPNGCHSLVAVALKQELSKWLLQFGCDGSGGTRTSSLNKKIQHMPNGRLRLAFQEHEKI